MYDTITIIIAIVFIGIFLALILGLHHIFDRIDMNRKLSMLLNFYEGPENLKKLAETGILRIERTDDSEFIIQALNFRLIKLDIHNSYEDAKFFNVQPNWQYYMYRLGKKKFFDAYMN